MGLTKSNLFKKCSFCDKPAIDVVIEYEPGKPEFQLDVCEDHRKSRRKRND